MKQSYLAILSGLILLVIIGMSWCGRPTAPQPGPATTPVPAATPAPSAPATPAGSIAPAATATPTASLPPSATPTPAPMQPASPELRKASAKVGPGVILVTTFDATGKIPRTGTGFFVASDGRLMTNWHLVQDAAYAVAKSPDGKIRNITGVVASAPALDLAILKAETKTGVSSVHVGKAPENAAVALVGSSLVQKEQPLGAVTISGRESAAGGDALVTSTTLSVDSGGAPLIDQDGNVVGVVAVVNEANLQRRAVIRPGDAIASLIGQTHSDSPARWPNGPNETPTPTPTPAPKGKVVYAPAPIYPEKARNARPPLAGSGRFRIVFDATGQVKEVQIVKSTAQPILDQAAVEAFRKWKSTPTPGHEWSLLIPISFRP